MSIIDLSAYYRSGRVARRASLKAEIACLQHKLAHLHEHYSVSLPRMRGLYREMLVVRQVELARLAILRGRSGGIVHPL